MTSKTVYERLGEQGSTERKTRSLYVIGDAFEYRATQLNRRAIGFIQ
jgi:hypothetical protein